MIERDPRRDERDFAEPSDRLVELVLELDAAFHEGRPPRFDEFELSRLSDAERRQLDHSRRQFERLYGGSMPTPVRSSKATVSMSAADAETLPDLASVFGGRAGKIGRFEVERGLGMGAHGVVLLARDAVLNRRVALKVPRPDSLLNAGLRKRFMSEGRAAALLMHPNIVTVFESGEIGPICYLAQDYIAGPSLADWLCRQTGPVEGRAAARAVLQLADALALAHSQQILHRDIKPGNILLAPKEADVFADGLDAYVPKLADFSIAKILQDGHHTETGTLLGTPAYMSPEQAAGRTKAIGMRSDLYSLGAVCYELLTNRPLYRGENVQETLQLVLHSCPQPPRAIVPGIPRDLEAICLKCLRREPQDRYATAQDVADDLRRFLDGRPVTARPQSAATTFSRWAQRNPAMAALAGLSSLAILAALASSLWYNARLNASLQTLRDRTDALRRRVYADDLQGAGKAFREGQAPEVRQRLEAWLPKLGETDIRSFPWWLLWNQLESKSQVIGTFAGNPTGASIAVSPRWDSIATGEPDGVIRLRALPGGDILGELHGHAPGHINALHFIPSVDGALLASGSDDGTVRLWNADTMEKMLVLRGHEGDVMAVQFLGVGAKTLASGGADGVIRLWDSQTGELQAELRGHTNTVRALVEDISTGTLFSCSQDDTVRAWDWKKAQPEFRFPNGQLTVPGDATWARGLSINPDGGLLTAGFRTGSLFSWMIGPNCPKPGRVHHSSELPGGIRSVAWLDSHAVILGLNDSRLVIAYGGPADVDSYEFLPGHADWTLGIDIVPGQGQNSFVTISKDGTIRYWPSREIGSHWSYPRSRGEYIPPTWNGTTLVFGKGHKVYGYDTPEGRRTFRHQAARCAVLTSDKSSLLTQTCDGNDYHFVRKDVVTGEVRWALSVEAEYPNRAVLSFDGRTVYLGMGNAVWAVDVESGEKRVVLRHPLPVTDLACHPDNGAFITACADGKVRFWRSGTGELLSEHLAHFNSLACLALSPDGTLLATSADDTTIRVWLTDEMREFASFNWKEKLRSLAFVDGARTLAALGREELLFWSVHEQQELLRWPVPRDSHIAVNLDQTMIALQSGNDIRLLRGAPPVTAARQFDPLSNRLDTPAGQP